MAALDLTPEQILPAFPGAKLANIQHHWPFVRSALQEAFLDNSLIVAYALGTIAAETAGFVPLTEAPSRYNTRVKSFDRYEKKRGLGNTEPGDGARFPGRGYVQLTGRYNYQTYGERIGVDLLQHPERANDPRHAAQILALFIADREPKILDALREPQWAAARKLVNGGTHGLDRFKKAYLAIRAAQ